MIKFCTIFAATTLSISNAFSTIQQHHSCRSPFSFSTKRRVSHQSLFPSSNNNNIIGPINEDIFDAVPPLRIEGNSLKTWAFPSGTTKRIQVSIRSTGRPIEASVELWQTPSYTPTKFKVECEDGSDNIVHSIVELPRGHPVTVAVYNTEGQEFPMEVSVAEMDNGSSDALSSFQNQRPQCIEGGKAVKSYSFGPGVEFVEVLLTSQMRNMKAYIEILHGPNDDDEVIEVETDNANVHPFYTVIQASEGCNTLRIINENSVEFPIEAYVRPFDAVGDEQNDQFNYGGPYF